MTLLVATACTPVAAQQSDDESGSAEGSEPDCTPLPAPYLVSPEITAPEWPFYGVVTVFEDYDATPSRIVVRFHDAVTRNATDIAVASATFPYWANISTTTAGVLFGPISEYSFYSSRPGCDDAWSSDRTEIVIPWGETARLMPADVKSGPGYGQLLPWNAERFTTGGTTFQIASEGRRVHLRAGDSTGSYELSGTGHRGSDDAPGYQRLDGYWDYLRGTDGEHLVIASWPEEPAAAPEQIYVLSLRAGEIVACGILWDLRMEFVAPPGDGLLVDEPALPPAGEIDLDDACQRDLDGEFFSYLSDLPETAPRSPAVPQPIDLPDQRAPESSFHGMVHSYTQRSLEVFDGRRHVQFYDIDAGKLTEVVIDDFDFVGLELRLEPGSSGISIARHEPTGTRLVLPWGGLPVLLGPQDRRFIAGRTQSLASAPDHGAEAARLAGC